MQLAASQELYAYWTKLRGARRAPERNEIDPGAIRGVLADTFILEADPALGYPMRIAGSRTSSFFLRELRGAPFLDLWRGADCPEVLDILASVADDASPMLAGVSARPHGMPAVEFELLLLPLRTTATRTRASLAAARRKQIRNGSVCCRSFRCACSRCGCSTRRSWPTHRRDRRRLRKAGNPRALGWRASLTDVGICS